MRYGALGLAAWCLLALVSSPASGVGVQEVRTSSDYMEVRLIQVEVRVTRDGSPVPNLRREDFTVREDGKPQEIRYFEYVENSQLSEADSTLSQDKGSEHSTSPTWIYIAPEFANPHDFTRAASALREFIQDELPPGFRVSFGGLPFTARKDLLLAILVRMLQAPYGGASTPAVVDPALAQLDDLEFQRLLAEEVRKGDGQLVPLAGFGRDPLFSGTPDQIRYFKIERIDRQMPLYGELALLRYRELVQRMSALPGKKAVVLFRPGLRLHQDNVGLMEDVVSSAVRQRVSFYTLDPSGLETVIATEDRRATLAWETGRYRPNTNIMREHMRAGEARAGLEALADESGGESIDNTNDLGAVLEAVKDDATDYYLLEYYAGEKRTRGRFHKIDVEVDVPGVKVETVRGYYEPKPRDEQSEQELSRDLYRAMVSTIPGQLDLSGSVELFADNEMQPVMIYSAGVRPDAIAWATKEGKRLSRLTFVSRVHSPFVVQLPDYQEQRVEPALELEQWEELYEDPAQRMTLSSRLPLRPGPHALKMVLQDRESGRLGSFEKRIDVPDFTLVSTPSTLLMTAQVRSVQGEGGEEADSADPSNPHRLLRAGDLVYVPQAANRFRRGEVIYLLYHLYNPTLEDLEHTATRGMQLGLLRDGLPVAEVRAHGQPFRDPEDKIIRFTAWIYTDNLEPGDYSVMVFLPGFANREVPGLEEEFTLLPDYPERRGGEDGGDQGS